jgi:hypothetical protein
VKLELRVSGGMAGLRRAPVELDTRERADGPELEALATRVAGQEPSPAAGADRFQYDLTVDGRSLRLHEGALTPEAAELIARLRA